MLNQLECKIPPLIQLLIGGGLALLLAEYLPLWQFSGVGLTGLALLFIIVAVVLVSWALLHFYRAGTTVSPLQPKKASRLVTSGPLAHSRNPMYLAMALALAGWIVYLGALSGLLALGLFLWAMQRLQIIPEERALAAQLGQPYLNYCKRVRRWL